MNQTDMSQGVLESLSAGMDGELSDEQLRFLLRRLEHDAPLRNAWARYHIVRDGVRQQLPAMASPGFASRVMQAIEHDVAPGVAPATASRRSHWLRWSTGGAIAASVAAAALMLGQPAGDSGRIAATPAAAGSRTVAEAAPVASPAMPAAVPPWLSGDSAGLLSQQASATFGAPLDQGQSVYAGRLSDYPRLRRYRTLNNHDGSYLLLLDPDQRAVPEAQQRTTVISR